MSGNYTPVFLTNDNWWEYKPSLGLYPARMSFLKGIESTIQVKSVSLKYVYEGAEHYNVGKQRIALKNNQFLVANRFNECKVFINEHHPSKGICIDFDEKYLAGIVQYLHQPNDIDEVEFTTDFLTTDALFSHALGAQGNMKRLLFWFAQQAQANNEMPRIDDFIKELALETILSQHHLIKEYKNTGLLTSIARKEMYIRLLKAKEIINDTCTHDLTIKHIAQQVHLSEFRFHHMFKKVFGLTPHKYQLEVIMKKALQLQQKDHLPWVTIAQMTGFNDLSSFSKVFKKFYGVSPRNFNP